jgi:lipoprotein signal peptidase
MKRIFNVMGAVGILLLDIVSKRFALIACKTPQVITMFLSCELVINRGFSWSMFHSENTAPFVAVSAVIVGIIGLLAWHTYSRFYAGLSYSWELLVLAGALGNLIDRVLYHGVVDFIVIGYGSFVWPTFNLADMAIVIGVFGMLFKTLYSHEE